MDSHTVKKLARLALSAGALVALGAATCPPPKPQAPEDPNRPGALNLTRCFDNTVASSGFYDLPRLCWNGRVTAGTGSNGRKVIQDACSEPRRVPAPAGNRVCASTLVTDLEQGTWEITVPGGGRTCLAKAIPTIGSLTVEDDGRCVAQPQP
jgi:hypothetical protein